MARFEINGKEYELKLSFKAVEYLNSKVEGGAFGLIGKVMQGDIGLFPHIVFAGLLHTEENIPLKDVEKAVEDAITDEKLDFADIYKISNEVVTKSFFYKKMVQNLVKQNPEMEKAMEKLDHMLN